MAVTVYAPVEGFTGVVVGVAFDHGVATGVDLDASQRRYLASHGYGLGRPPTPVTGAAKVDQALKVHVGSALHDASLGESCRVTVLVDGAVVYEGSHDAGEVSEFVAEARENVAHDLAPPVEPPQSDDGGQVERPNVREGKAAWVTYALTQPGADPDEVAGLTKEALIERYGHKEP